MFNLDVDARLSTWSTLRKQLSDSQDPLQELANFWSTTPFTAHNHNIDPYYSASWPTPWEIIVENKYDDFTKAIMIGYTLLLTDLYKDSQITIKTLIDDHHNRLYNVVVVDEKWAINYFDNQVVTVDNIPSLYRLENLVELKWPR
jgi:transposase